MLTLDESGDECAGDQKAGAARQYLGREGKVDMGQVGVASGYYKHGIWTLVGVELYLPEVWFDQAHAKLRERWHIPAERTFATKLELGLRLVRRAKAARLPLEVVGCDSVYGQDGQFRTDLDAENVVYMADIPANTHVYLTKPVVGIPETPPGKKGRPFSQPRVLNEAQPVEVRTLVGHPDLVWQPVAIRQTERGLLTYDCAARRVWTLTPKGEVREEWLFLRREPELQRQLAVEVLPALSMANVRELLRAVMPLEQLSPETATRLVIKHLVNRSSSTRSRLKAQCKNRGPT
jgi:hypothetical protein